MRTVVRQIPIQRIWDLYDFNPFTGKLISRTTGKPVKGFLNRQGYLRMTVWYDGRPIQRPYSRVVFAWCTGFWPIHDVDHINRNVLDNRIWNLRDVPSRINQQNRGNFKGAYWNKEHKHWRAQATLNGKLTFLGSFATQEEAANVYWQTIEKYNLEDARKV